MNRNVTTPKDLFFNLVLLTTFFLLLEISFFIQCNKAYLSDFTLVSRQISIPWRILPGALYFFCAQLMVHIGYCLFIWWMTLSLTVVFRVSVNKLGIALWILGVVTILTSNQYFFPNSKFAELTALLLFNRTIVASVFFVLISIFALPIIAAGIITVASKPRTTVMISLAASVGFFFDSHSPIQDAATVSKPNIIIVGVDSVRPDFLSYFGHHKQTPFFDTFLREATVFNQAVTPLARTFPAWTSILTGLYPKQNGIRTDLANQDQLKVRETLSSELKQRGYQTLFATDETRFSNIDQHYGFDQVISPPIGLNDFLIGTFNDFPLSNLLVNTTVGRWLFPYSDGNRPVFFTYDPDRFLQLLRPALETKRTQPLFLAIHFCLPHTPYLWAGLHAHGLSAVERYEATIMRMDQQLRDFFALLQQAKLLNHAIVVLLSDHGEALELTGDRVTDPHLYEGKPSAMPKFYPPMLDNENINQSAGHGTDVLGLTQYRTLLAFKLYGVGQQHIGNAYELVSLVDIKATLLGLLDGQAKGLVPIIKNSGLPPVQTRARHIFLESDFSPSSIRTVYPETRDVLLEGIQLFQIDPITTRLTVKDRMSQMIIDSKQYADIYGEWILALYPQQKQVYIPILVNLTTGAWTDNLHSPLAKQSPATAMLAALQRFYGIQVMISLNSPSH